MHLAKSRFDEVNMYKQNPEEIQNRKCLECKFCVWNEERHEYVCDIKGCYENNKFVEFKLSH